jgi:hypothetical protein
MSLGTQVFLTIVRRLVVSSCEGSYAQFHQVSTQLSYHFIHNTLVQDGKRNDSVRRTSSPGGAGSDFALQFALLW